MRRNNDVFKHNEINAVEPPLGGRAILSYLNEKFGDRIYGEIVKTGCLCHRRGRDYLRRSRRTDAGGGTVPRYGDAAEYQGHRISFGQAGTS